MSAARSSLPRPPLEPNDFAGHVDQAVGRLFAVEEEVGDGGRAKLPVTILRREQDLQQAIAAAASEIAADPTYDYANCVRLFAAGARAEWARQIVRSTWEPENRLGYSGLADPARRWEDAGANYVRSRARSGEWEEDIVVYPGERVEVRERSEFGLRVHHGGGQ